jgi:predicted MPP superfamily phosphohydrolase
MTAVQISDLHLNEPSDAHSRMVSMVKALKPDVIFFTGDLVNDASAVDGAIDIFRSLEAPGGIWAVLGNSDHSADVADTLPIQLNAAKVKYLRNASAQLEDGLWLIGVDDPATANEDLNTAMQDVPAGAPRILLAHSPDIATSIQKRSFDLILAGHTHGGQINLPILNGAWLLDGPSRQYVEGLYDLDGSPLYVNRGIGMAKLPVRIGARPEITHFTFDAA